MKTIFRYANVGLLVAVILALGAVAGFAQDACGDDEATATARNEAGDKVRADFAAYGQKSLDDRGKVIDNAKAFLDKYQACAQAKDLVDYLKQYLPGMETGLQQARVKKEKDDLVLPFDAALKANKWDDVMATGKKILAKYPDEYRPVEIVLAALAGEEGLKNNFKFADDGIRFGKLAIADLEAGKSFMVGKDTRYGLTVKGAPFGFDTREDALGWLNLYIGYTMAIGQKNKSGALPYLYKASQAVGSDTSKRSLPYDLIGGYYFDELDKVIAEIKTLIESQKPDDAEDIAKQKVDAIKAKEALSFGLAERAMDAYARAHKIEVKDLAVKARLKTNVEKAYFVRFAKKDGVDAWIASAVVKPFVNPTTPVAPITDAAPATTTPATTTPTATTPAATTAGPKATTTSPAPTKAPVSPATKPAAQPATKPASGTKPSATVKKPAKRKVA